MHVALSVGSPCGPRRLDWRGTDDEGRTMQASLDPAKLMAFVCIWAGLAVYSLDIWLHLGKRQGA